MKTILHVILITSIYLASSSALATNHYNHWSKKHTENKHQQLIKDLKAKSNHNIQWSTQNPLNNSSRYSSYSYSSSGNSSASARAYSSSSSGTYTSSWTSTNAHSVPELDSNAAPLAGLLLTGLLAAGYERRRRKQLKTIKD